MARDREHIRMSTGAVSGWVSARRPGLAGPSALAVVVIGSGATAGAGVRRESPVVDRPSIGPGPRVTDDDGGGGMSRGEPLPLGRAEDRLSMAAAHATARVPVAAPD